jgi:uncharacterized repeat protein (TIGR01451 family)
VTRELRAPIALIVSLIVPFTALAQSPPGTVSAWGWDGYGQLGDGITTYYSGTPVQVSGLTGITAVATGAYHGLALKNDGTVWAWGGNPNGELGDGASYYYSSTPVQVSGLTGVTAIACGYYHNLALKSDGTVWAWGINSLGELGIGIMGIGIIGASVNTPVQVTGLSGVTEIAAGEYHSLALTSGGTVWAWGDNTFGELGNGTTTNSLVPIQVGGGFTGAVAIAAGGDLSLAMKSGGTLWAWGNNSQGQLGNGTTTNSSTPVQVSGLTGEVAFGAGLNYGLALKNDGTVWAWGNNSFEGQGAVVASSTPVQVTGLTGEKAIAAGSYQSLALKSDGTVWALGYNIYGELGNGTTVSSSTAVQVSGLTGVMTIAAGEYNGVALKSDGTVWAWGWNGFAQLGNGIAPFRTSPVQATGLTGVVAVAGGSSQSLAVKNDGTLWDSGLNAEGELGNGNTTNSSTPVQVVTSGGGAFTNVENVAGGFSHSLAVRSDGTVWAWGNNSLGELGNGTTTISSTPVQVSGLSGVEAVGAGQFYSLAIKSDGTVWAWGWNIYGQLGNGTTTNSSTPVQVSGLTSVVAISAGEYHGLALESDGTVWAWGDNAFGELGNGTTTNSSTPVQVSGLPDVVAVAGGEYHSLALTSAGAVWAWGNDGNGQLGNGTEGTPGSLAFSSTPVQVIGLAGAVAVAAGNFHSLALKSDGTVWVWGSNAYGQLGNGTYTDSVVPIQVSGLSGVVAVAGGGYHSLASVAQLTPALSIAKSHSGSFGQGQQGATYTVTVANGAGAAPTSGIVTVTDTLPSGLMLVSMAGTGVGSGWTCAGNTCTRGDVLEGGSSYPPITVTVNVAANATSPQVNAASVSGGGSAMAGANDSTTIISGPVLSITKTHTGSFTQGQQGVYTVTVSNGAGTAPTSGTITVTEMLPTGLTLVSMAGGSGWSCASNICSRSDVLNPGSSYSAITVTVNVAATASSPQVNQVSVSGGGSAAGAAMDSTNITVSAVSPFFATEASLGSGVYYMMFPDGNVFGYYNFVASSIFYHYDMGYEAFVPGSAADIYLFDFTSSHWLYTSNVLFPYLFDFTLNNWLYYFPDTKNPGHYTTNPRYFSNPTTGKIFSM